MRQLGFATEEQARHDSRPNRVYLRYGLIVHLRLLPTPPRGDAVTLGYEVPEHFDRDLHPADSMQLQAHSSTLCVVFDSGNGGRQRTRSVQDGIPTRSVGTRKTRFTAIYSRIYVKTAVVISEKCPQITSR